MIKKTFFAGEYLLVWSSGNVLESVSLYREQDTLILVDHCFLTASDIEQNWEQYKKDIQTDEVIHVGESFFG